MFNQGIKSLTNGTWHLRVNLGDGSNNIVKFRLKK